MYRLLLTGLSGTGKSALVADLQERGQLAVDLDCEAYSHWVAVDDPDAVEPGRDWMWREDAVEELLSAERGDALFVSGCAPNMGRFLTTFDSVVLLTAPSAVIAARLGARPRGEYGSSPRELARVLAQIDTVEPLLRRVADHEIDTSGTVAEAVAAVLRVAGR